jgi:hypothetical protein
LVSPGYHFPQSISQVVLRLLRLWCCTSITFVTASSLTRGSGNWLTLSRRSRGADLPRKPE